MAINIKERTMKSTFLILFTLFTSGMALATEQQPDILVYDDQELYLSTGWGHPSPLETYYYQNNIETPFRGFSTANYRGHIAVWEVTDDKMYLKEIRIEDYDPNTHEFIYDSYAPYEYGVEPNSCPPEENGAVLADWFSGVLDCYLIDEGSYCSYFFHVRDGSIVEMQIITEQDYDVLYNSPEVVAVRKDYRDKLKMLVLNENYITYCFRLNEDDEIEYDEEDCRLNTGFDRLSPIFGIYDNNHLNWPYNWENLEKSGAPHCKWLIKDDKLYLTGMELYSGLSFYEIDTETLDLTNLFDEKVIDGVVDANWVSGVYLMKHGNETKESAGWPGLYFTVFNVTGYTIIRLDEGKLIESYNVPKDFDPENLPEDIDPGLKQIIEDYELPTIDDLPPKVATDPSPVDGAVFRRTWTSLSWTGTETADSHDVYFGDNFADVKDGIGNTFQGNQTFTSFDVGLPGSPFPEGLVFGTTYYWRIDEVEADGTKYKGRVWSFTINDVIVVERQVSAREDDGYAASDNLQNLSSSFITVGVSSSAGPPYCMSGMVFRNVNIPQGAEIVSASLKIQSYYRYLDDIVYARIEAEAVDNAESLGSIRHPLHSRLVDSLPRTNASVEWDYFEPWVAETWYESPDIADVIQEVIDRAGWLPNNSLTILYSNRDIEGGYRNFFSYDSGRNDAPKLKITYAIE